MGCSTRFHMPAAKSCQLARCWLALAALLLFSCAAPGDDSAAANAERLQKMTTEQKESLSRKRHRFDELEPAEQQRLRDLHAEISAAADRAELVDTATRYKRWLENLDPAERSALLDIKDSAERIARIKEIMQQQEERRFKQYFENLPREDRETIYHWLGEFVVAHANEIRDRLPESMRQRIDQAADGDARRRELFMTWQGWRRRYNLPYPSGDDLRELLKRFSPETQKAIESTVANELAKEEEDHRTPDRKAELERERLENIMRTALYSRFFPQISEDELLKFFAAMKSDDSRRKQLEGKEGWELRRELQRMYNSEHFLRRGGPSGSSGSSGRSFGPPGSGPPGPGPGRDPRDDDRDSREGERGATSGKESPPQPTPANADKAKNR